MKNKKLYPQKNDTALQKQSIFRQLQMLIKEKRDGKRFLKKLKSGIITEQEIQDQVIKSAQILNDAVRKRNHTS